MMAVDNKEDPTFSDVEDKPSPYGLGTFSLAPRRKQAAARGALWKNKKMLFVGGSALVIVVASIVAISLALHHAQVSPTISSSPSSSTPAAGLAAAASDTGSAGPMITIGAQKKGNLLHLTVQWNDLPNGTVKINIFYSAAKNEAYALVGSIPVVSSTTGGGRGYLDITNGNEAGYYYGTASDDDGTSLWTSPPAPPADIVPTTTPSSPATSPSSPSSASAPSSSSSNQDSDNTTNENPPSGNNNGTTVAGAQEPDADDGTPAPVQNFLVQHFDKKIQISWRVLPADAFRVVVSRAASDDGPWTAVLTETDVATGEPYSIEIVDDTLGDPYYYKMDVYDEDSSTVATYGPILLAPL